MKRILAALTVAASALVTLAGPAGAWQPPGQRGYEGQPGNQGGHHGHQAPGQLGYEGQPGNQGG